jgi:hypothetical protein
MDEVGVGVVAKVGVYKMIFKTENIGWNRSWSYDIGWSWSRSECRSIGWSRSTGWRRSWSGSGMWNRIYKSRSQGE